MLRRSLSAALLLAGAFALRAEAQLLGSEFQVHSYTTYRQELPAVSAAGDGSFLVVWSGACSAQLGDDVCARRFDANGAALADPFVVNSYTTYSQMHPEVSSDADGNFVVVWESLYQPQVRGSGGDRGIFGQRFSSTADPIGSEFLVNTYSTDSQYSAAVSRTDSGSFVVVWTSRGQDGSDRGVFGQRFAADASLDGDEFQVNTTTTYGQHRARVATTGASSFVVVWQDESGASAEARGQRFDGAGTKAGPEFLVNTYSTGDQSTPDVSADGSGNFVAVWGSSQFGGDSPDGSGSGVFGQRFDASGNKVGPEFQVNSYTTGDQYYPRVARQSTGEFLVVWQSKDQDGDFEGVFGQRFDATGNPLGQELAINTYTTGIQRTPAVARYGPRDYVAAWQSGGEVGQSQDGDNGGIYGRQIRPTIFVDGFDLTADTCVWSYQTGGCGF
jgi:hypothetical protein